MELSRLGGSDECHRGRARRLTAKTRRAARLFIMSGALLLAATGRAQIVPSGSVTNWVPILWGDPDPGADQQTGSSESDIVGSAAQASFYTLFSNGGTTGTTADDQWGFRFRLAAEKNPPGYSHIAFVGLDANLDGRLDLFLGVNNQGSVNELGIWAPTVGTNLNVSPNTLSINSSALFSYAETGSNYNWMTVTTANDPVGPSYNIDGASGAGETDRFLTFVLPMDAVVSAMTTVGITNFSQNTVINYVVGTSTQINSINQDLNGVDGGVNSTTLWSGLGALSGAYTVTGVAVPEPGALALLTLAGVGLVFHYRRHSQRRG